MRRFSAVAASVVIAAFAMATELGAQQLGYKLLGGSGIDAGVQSPPGLFVINRLMRYSADELRNRNGDRLPIDGLDIHALGNALGASYTMVTHHGQYISFAAAVPLARVGVSSERPAASINGWGFSDVFLQPLKVGWRKGPLDLVTGYLIYMPTGKFEPRGGSVGKGYWTHQMILGGAVSADSLRMTRASLLASYEMNTRNRYIDVRRGNMLHLQGGVGAGVLKVATIGIAGFALWQVTGDRGADIPDELRGQWSRVFGVGPEIDVVIPRWKLRADVRIERELGVRSRPQGYVTAFGVSRKL